MASEVPDNCPNCGTPLLSQSVHRFGVALGAEIALSLLICAFFVPMLWARLICGIIAAALFSYSLLSANERKARICPDCRGEISSSGGTDS